MNLKALTVALLLLCFAKLSHAEDKPKVAVLGLEVAGKGPRRAQAVKAAANLTRELRAQATKPTFKYRLAPNSSKDLLELKFLSDCIDEGRGCMSQIGRELGADRLLYGFIERKRKGYSIQLKLLNTNTKELERSTSEFVTHADLEGQGARLQAETLFRKLSGTPSTGTIAIELNIDAATVYLDGRVAGKVRDGEARLTRIKEGSHALRIEAGGYKSYEAEVVVSAEDTESLSVSLMEGGGFLDNVENAPKEDSRSAWRDSFEAGALVSAGLGGAWAYHGYQFKFRKQDQLNSAFADVDALNHPPFEGLLGGDRCANVEGYDMDRQSDLAKVRSLCKDGHRHADRAILFGSMAIATSLATAYFGYQGWFADSAKGRRRGKRKSQKPSQSKMVLVPQFGPDGVGAGLSLTF